MISTYKTVIWRHGACRHSLMAPMFTSSYCLDRVVDSGKTLIFSYNLVLKTEVFNHEILCRIHFWWFQGSKFNFKQILISLRRILAPFFYRPVKCNSLPNLNRCYLCWLARIYMYQDVDCYLKYFQWYSKKCKQTERVTWGIFMHPQIIKLDLENDAVLQNEKNSHAFIFSLISTKNL
jgi:hypothetical protein